MYCGVGNKSKYYVYQLIDPKTDIPFYVGKGCGNRMYRHVSFVKSGKIPNRTNIKLFLKITEILKSGNNVVLEKIEENLTELESLALECAFIEHYGFDNICNSPNSVGFNLKFRMKSKHSEKSREKMSMSHKKLYEGGYIAPMFGKKHSEEYKSTRREMYLGKNNPNYGNHKISGKNHPNFNSVIYRFFNEKTNTSTTCTGYDLRIVYNLDQGAISRLVSNKIRSHKGWVILN